MTDQAQQSAEHARAVQSAEMFGKPMFAITLVMIYGIYQIIQEGVWPAWPDGTILVAGGILSMIFVVLYVRSIEAGSGKSWAKAAAAFGGFVPYVYSLYVIGYVGVWSLVQLVTVGITLSGLAGGLFGLVFGYRTLKTFYDITELSAQKA
ncbi:hypothetical protein ELH43_38765 [Rhizobium ruizarguesonis]|jgi:hypothetical protein|uniref:hypothetical protein n=1 Tax=Rhizobium ruizarguesonis TaxID=2081791 RepID=UPI00102FC20D|nr:hypothetical protein [Rhizobium ruizarguesonis]TBB59418.1 hypothetical protein ELH43_38765 [Rhizobium ruizarguesonis]TBC12673.1 hypothetical protein ELH35_38175 [Rhizobium ruizarguesonis]